MIKTNSKSNLRLFAILTAAILAFSCATVPKGYTLLQASRAKVPNWIGKVWEKKNTVYAAGGSFRALSVEESRASAIRDTAAKLAYKAVKHEKGTKRDLFKKFEAALSDDASIEGLEIKRVYQERWQSPAGELSYSTHILVTLDLSKLPRRQGSLKDESDVMYYENPSELDDLK